MWSAGCILGELLQTLEAGRTPHPLFPGGGSALSDEEMGGSSGSSDSEDDEEDEDENEPPGSGGGRYDEDGHRMHPPTDGAGSRSTRVQACVQARADARAHAHVRTEVARRDYQLRHILDKVGVPCSEEMRGFPPLLRARYSTALQQLQHRRRPSGPSHMHEPQPRPHRPHRPGPRDTGARAQRPSLRATAPFRRTAPALLDMLEHLLELNPARRPTAAVALRNPAFEQVRAHWRQCHPHAPMEAEREGKTHGGVVMGFDEGERLSSARLRRLVLDEVLRYAPRVSTAMAGKQITGAERGRV
eukprot:g4211.t1